MRGFRLWFSWCFGLFLVFAGELSARSILVDFGTTNSFRGISVSNPDANGKYWNGFAPGDYLSNMVDSSNQVTTIDLGFTTGFSTDSYNGPAGATSNPPTTNEIANTAFDAAALGELGVTNAVFEYFSSGSNSIARFTLSGLNAARQYNLEFFGSKKYPIGEIGGNNDSRSTQITASDSNGVPIATTNLIVGVFSSHNTSNTASLYNILPDDNNRIFISFNGVTASNSGYLNCFKIEENPLPQPEQGGQTVLIDFGNDQSFRGTNVANPDVNGNYWNSIWSATYYTNLLDMSNGLSGVKLGFDSVTGTDSFNGPGGVFDDVALGWIGVTNAVNDYYVNSDFQLQGLDPDRTYNLTFFSSHKYSADAATLYEIFTDSGYTTLVASATLNVQNPSSPSQHNQGDVVTITNLSPQANDSLYIRFSGSTTNNGYLNALRVDAFVPPPPLYPEIPRGEETILVDFGNDLAFNGTNVVSPDEQGSYWNSIWAGQLYTNLVDVSNNLTAVDIGFDATLGSENFNGPGGAVIPGALQLLAATNAVNDYYLSSSFQIQNLEADRIYNLAFFGSHKFSPDTTTVYSVYTDSAYTQLVASVSLDVQMPGSPWQHNSNTVALLTNLVPQANNALYVKFEGASGTNGYLNAMQIDAFDPVIVIPSIPLGDETVLIDFGNDSSFGGSSVVNPDVQGSYWNSIWAGSYYSNMVDIGNNPTTLDLGFDAAGGSDSYNGPNGAIQSNWLGLLAGSTNALNDYYFSSSFQVQGLDPNRTYNLTFFGSHKFSADDETVYSVYADNGYSNLVASASVNVQHPGLPWEHNSNTVAMITNLSPQAGNIFYIKFEGASGSNGFLNAMQIDAFDPPTQTNTAVIFGSSVAKGWNGGGGLTNGSYVLGYAGRMTPYLESQGFIVTNNSVAGNDTEDANNRYDSDVVPLQPDILLIGLSLANEGIIFSNDKQVIYNKFRDGMSNLVERSRTNGFYPVIGLVYPNNQLTTTTYDYVRSMNLLLNTWDVPSINLLGALDDGSGKWATNYWSDNWHPNSAGHLEMNLAWVPSLFDAIRSGKTSTPAFVGSSRFARVTPDPTVLDAMSFAPTNLVHSFTMNFKFRTTGTGSVAAVRTALGGYATLEVRDTELALIATNGTELTASVNANDGSWYDVAVVYSYATRTLRLFVDGVEHDTALDGEFTANRFVLGGPDAAPGKPAPTGDVDFRDWCIYRSAWHGDEALSQSTGGFQQASLEIYAPLNDAQFLNGGTVDNQAQSLSLAYVHGTNVVVGDDAAVILTVISDHGSPVPPEGGNSFAPGTVLTNSVGDVTDGGTQFVVVGWALSGNDPAVGSSETFTMTLTNNATLTWLWGTSYWLDVETSGSGSVDAADSWIPSGVMTNLTATPDAGSYFNGWTGDAAGMANPLTVTMNGSKAITAMFIPVDPVSWNPVFTVLVSGGAGYMIDFGTNTPPDWVTWNDTGTETWPAANLSPVSGSDWTDTNAAPAAPFTRFFRFIFEP